MFMYRVVGMECVSKRRLGDTVYAVKNRVTENVISGQP